MEPPKIQQIHPMFVPFSGALFPVAFAAFCLYCATGMLEFEAGAFVCALFGLVATPLTAATGFLDWWTHYKAYMTSVFRIKIAGAIVLMALAAAAVLLRAYHPGLVRPAVGGARLGVFRPSRRLRRHMRGRRLLRGETRLSLIEGSDTESCKGGNAMGSPEMVAIVHRAIDRERDAISVYLGLAKIVTEAKAKNVLIHLASDEVGHMTKLEKHLISVLRGKDWVIERADLVEAMSEQVSQSSLLEKFDAKKLAKADTIQILGVAIDREIEAERFYREMAGRSKKDSAKEMFLSLAKEEELHAKILRAEVDSIGLNGFWCDMQEFTMEQ